MKEEAQQDTLADKPLIFCHIPKCGGSSLRESVRDMIGDDLVTTYRADDKKAFDAAPRRAMRGKKALFGHLTFPVHPQFMTDAEYFTILRDPVDRLISMLNYHRWNETAPNRDLVEGLNDRDALTALLHPSLGHYNAITRFFGRPNDPLSAFQVACRHFVHIGHVEESEATFKFLADRKLSNGAPVVINTSQDKPQVEISYKDRAFIRGHMHNDLRLHDMLVNRLGYGRGTRDQSPANRTRRVTGNLSPKNPAVSKRVASHAACLRFLPRSYTPYSPQQGGGTIGMA